MNMKKNILCLLIAVACFSILGTFFVYSKINTSKKKNILKNINMVYPISLSPDGEKITFITSWRENSKDSYRDLCVINVDGSNFQPLTYKEKIYCRTLPWSVDSHKIAFINIQYSKSEEPAPATRLIIMDITSKKLRAVVKQQTVLFPIWVKDKIAFIGSESSTNLPDSPDPDIRWNIWLADIQRDIKRRITSSIIGHGYLASLSKKETIFYFKSQKKRKNLWNNDLWMVDLKTNKEIQITKNLDIYPQVKVSPNEEWLSFIRYTSDAPSEGELWIMSCDGAIKRKFSADAIWPSNEWSPDSKRIAFSRRKEEYTSIWIIDINTGIENRLTKGLGDCAIGWTKKDRIVFTRKGNIWIMNSDGINQRQIFPKPE